MFLAVIALVLTIILVVGIHEAGHALAARIFKVKINKISIGFGKPLLQWQSNSGCTWVWALWPLGGYVQLQNTRISPVEPGEYATCFDKKPIWMRVVILLAGAFANLITAWFAFVLVYAIGIYYKVPQIESVQSNSIAAQAGFLAKEQFISIAGRPTPSWNEVGMELILFWGKKDVPITLSQPDSKELKKIKLDLSQVQFSGLKFSLLSSIGIVPDLSAKEGLLRAASFADALQQANDSITHMLYFFIMILKQLFSGVIPFSILLGPLGVFAASIASLKQGIIVFMFFIATLSLAVALVNLFPVPGLDGGSIIYALIEKVRGKSLSIALEVLLHRLVFIIFCLVLIHLLMNDLQRI